MSSESWQENLRQKLQHLRKPDQPPRVAVVGVGHELRGDDAAGVAVARALGQRGAEHDGLLVIEAGPAPENACARLRRFGPQLVLMVDAAEMGAEAGTVRWLSCRAAAALSASTHSLPLDVVSDYLEAELGCEVALLGIQPASLAFDRPLSPSVQAAVAHTTESLAAALRGEAARPG